MKKIFSLAFIILAAGLFFTACGVQKDVGIKSITINEDSSVIEIYEGEFDEAGITATVVYEDDSTETIDITADMVLGEIVDNQQWFKVPGTYAITILFKGETVDLTIKVLPKNISVKFFNGYGILIKEQSIRKGSDAIAPNDGFEIEGMKFIGWDRSFTNLTEDACVYALYGNVTALNIETTLHDWQYRKMPDSSIYELFKFADGKIYHYQGDLESFLYSRKDEVVGVDYTAVYTSRVNEEGVFGSWKISFGPKDKEIVLYFNNESLYTKITDSHRYYKPLKTKYALQNNTWYQWVLSSGQQETSDINGYIKICSNAKIEFFRGTSAPTDQSEKTYLSYSMSINDAGNIVITTTESSLIQSLTIVCDAIPRVSNLDRNLSIVK